MSDTKINIEVVCDKHPAEKLEVVAEKGGSGYDIKLCVSVCSYCLSKAVEEIDSDDLPLKTAELVFNDSCLMSQTIEV